MNRVTTIFESSAVVIERFHHPADHAHRDPDSEITRSVAVTFVENGSFALRQDKKWWPFGSSDALVSVPGILRRYRHFEECPSDVCLSVSFAPEMVEDAVGELQRLSPEPRVAGGPATRFTRSLIKSALASGDPLSIEMAAFHCTLALASPSWKPQGRKSCSLGYARTVRNAIELMCQRLAEPCALSSISREVGMSPFHFARVFAELAGAPPHHYLLKLRLHHSARALRQGASVTTAALGSGFDNLSHFSRSFRRQFGVLPSQYPQTRQ